MFWCCCIDQPDIVAITFIGSWLTGNNTAGVPFAPVVVYPPAPFSRSILRYDPSKLFTATDTLVLVENVQIDQGDIVASANIDFALSTKSSFRGADVVLRARIDAWAIDNATDGPQPFEAVWSTGTDVDNEIRTTNRTADFTVWPFVNGDPAVGPIRLVTPDLAAMVNEVVSRPGWAIGNNLLFFMQQHGTGFSPENLEVEIGAPQDLNVPLGPNITTFNFTLA